MGKTRILHLFVNLHPASVELRPDDLTTGTTADSEAEVPYIETTKPLFKAVKHAQN